MRKVRFSRLAEADLLSIGAYTLRTWGEAQTIRYLGALEAWCRQLADNPASGRSCDDIQPGLSRVRRDSGFPHLHGRMLRGRHAFTGDV
jgi:plasmid stabilization system protein ParE